MSVTFSIILDMRREKKSSQTYPIKLMVTHKRATRPYQTIYDLSEEDYNKLKAPNISEGLQKVREGLKAIRMGLADYLDKIPEFDFAEFKRDYVVDNSRFKQRKTKLPIVQETNPDRIDYSVYHKKFPILLLDHGTQDTVGSVYCAYIKQLLSEHRIGNALKYRDSYNSLKKFGGNKYFRDITISWLRRYEKWMLERGRSRTTVGIALRALRCIFNEADHQGIINKQKCYPFGRRKYLIPTGKKVKKALGPDDLSKLYYDSPSCDADAYAKDLWFFCYFANGMNPSDLFRLKFKNMDGEYIRFYRSKTELTARQDPKLITVYINDDLRDIIDRWANKDVHADNYIFPILSRGLHPLEEYNTIVKTTQFINGWMKKIGERNGLEIKPTTIVTRHSFSRVMKRSGASTEFIQEALGHMDKKTTENYMGSFEDEHKKTLANNLVAFKIPEILLDNGITISK